MNLSAADNPYPGNTTFLNYYFASNKFNRFIILSTATCIDDEILSDEEVTDC